MIPPIPTIAATSPLTQDTPMRLLGRESAKH